jgi:2-polyprenyl-3-methyl-5-hydroxy-6-metoxy-1,4-benzoquinol methylase
MTFQRDLQPERMDDPRLPRVEHEAALAGLARLNRLTCVSRPIYRRLRRYASVLDRPLRVLDVATGSGDLPIDWARRSRALGRPMKITAIDISEVAIEFARERARRAAVDVCFQQQDCLASRLPTGFDVVTCSLFIHHLNAAEIGRLLVAMRTAASYAVVVCDLERSRANLAAVWLAAHALTRSPVVHEDAIKSVRAALTREEFRSIAESTLGHRVKIRSLPPCRYLAVLEGLCEAAPMPLLARSVQPA